MKAILRTNDYTRPYEIVDVIKNPFNNKNQSAHIRKSDGKEYFTGGILIKDDEITKKVLDTLTPKQQWDWLFGIKNELLVW